MKRNTGGRPKLQGSVVDRRRAKAVELALELFLAGGWQGVTMKGVANSMGYSTASLYKLFPNKTALMSETIRAHWPEVSKIVFTRFGVAFDSWNTLVSFLEFNSTGEDLRRASKI